MTLLRYLAVAGFSLLLVVPAQAHRFAPSLLKLTELAGDRYLLLWKTSAQPSSDVALEPVWPEHCSLLNSSPPQLQGTARVWSGQLQCRQLGDDGLVGETLGVSGLAANQGSAIVMVSMLDGRQFQQVLTAETTEFQVPAEPGAGQVVADYTSLGVSHIWGGPDHLLFVFGLLLLVGGGRRLLWTITAFTLGHSVTLSLVTLGYFEYPVALVEFTIALSVFVLAVELTREGGLLRRYPWWLAGGFGLLHGMGFAGALAETGLPQDNLPLALLFFNIGIELGQIAFIMLCLALWYLIKRPLGPSWGDRLLPVPIYLLGSLSAYWCIQRGLEALSL